MNSTLKQILITVGVIFGIWVFYMIANIIYTAGETHGIRECAEAVGVKL